jgi:PAS domain S-box-containing protein
MEKIVETILTNLPVGLFILDSKGIIIEANPSACRILGCPIEGFVGNNWGDIFLSQEQNSEFNGVVLDAIQKETPTIKRITPYQAPDGTKRYLSVISSAERKNGKIKAIVVLIEDLTDLYRMHDREKAILEQNHKLADQRAKSLIAFARSVAHQIRNPIMSIAGFTRLLERKANIVAREPLEAITEETRKLETIVRAVSEYSQITQGKVSSINLWVLIEEAKKRIVNHPLIKGQPIEWKTECPDMNIKADRDLMAQALSELFLNSVEFTESETSIRICAREENQNIHISITDFGSGFTPDGLKMAFDPFFTTKTVGAGMGLTRTKRIVNEHQGSVSIENTPNNGARVTISLPINSF